MSTKFFTNSEENTLIKKFEGVFTYNPNIQYFDALVGYFRACLLYTSPSPRDRTRSRMPSSAWKKKQITKKKKNKTNNKTPKSITGIT